MAVVKADAYGHGAAQAARVLAGAGADMLGVASLEEGIQLREAGIETDILILGYTQPEWAASVVEGGFIQTVYHLNLAHALRDEARRLGKTCRVHVKIDTGMGRIGIMSKKAGRYIEELAGMKELELHGVFTHLSCADVMDSEFTEIQLDRFRALLADLDARGIHAPCIHAANSAGVLRFKDSYFDMVRPGILLYGLAPSSEMKSLCGGFRPVMSIKTSIVELKTVPKGSRISYGGRFAAEKSTRVATVPAGYADGFSRRLSGAAHVLVQGRRAPIIGAVCMDFMMIDVTGIPNVSINEEAVLVGRQGGAQIEFDELAAHIGTINYEVVSLIGKRVHRLYTNYTGGNPAEL
jgi:alanine racemase